MTGPQNGDPFVFPVGVEKLTPPPKLPPATARYWKETVQAAREVNVCPVLGCSFHWRESRSGDLLTPPGPAGTGDFDLEPDPTRPGHLRHKPGTLGHGRGLMQLDDRKHAPRQAWVDAWLLELGADGLPLWTVPIENIRAGLRVYAENRTLFGPIAGIAAYNTRDVWVETVLRELRPGATPQELVADLDRYTSPKGKGDYVADVLAHRARWMAGWKALG